MPVERIGGEWLSPDDVEDGTVAVITQQPELVETKWTIRPDSDEKKKAYRIQVRLPNGELKDTTLNKTSSNALLDVLGPNEDSWLNKKVVIEKRLQKVRGEDRYVLYFKAAKQTVQTEIPEDEILTLTQAKEMTNHWPPQVAAGFINHLRASGRLTEGE